MNTAGVVEVNGPQSKEWLVNIHLDQIPAPLAVIRLRPGKLMCRARLMRGSDKL
jgi:hypothetical protein